MSALRMNTLIKVERVQLPSSTERGGTSRTRRTFFKRIKLNYSQGAHSPDVQWW